MIGNCCEVPRPAAEADRCPRCGAKGRPVSGETMKGLLKAASVERLRNVSYHFDATPECHVVYFSNEASSCFDKGDLTVRVGVKETTSPIPLCYCFGHTDDSVRVELLATGRSTVGQRITAEIQAGNCACEIKNPSGRCCLGEVNRAVQRIQSELASEAVSNVARVERG